MKRFSAIILSALLASSCAFAQSYPAKPVRMIVGYPPGGPTDVIARTVAQKMSAAFSQQVIVDNRPGASGMIGAELVVKAPADGYTLLSVPVTFAVTPSVYPKMPYRAEKDLAPASQRASEVRPAPRPYPSAFTTGATSAPAATVHRVA